VTSQLRPGETMGVLGPNGAGKTTVLRMLCSAFAADHALRDFSDGWKPSTFFTLRL
jgi:ABC-type multidrug transport system ATPase subunit